MGFELIPAIDLKQGKCVRLKQGKMDQATIYGDSPGDMARHWQDQGATRMHVVDLDGAFQGSPANQKSIQAICEMIDIPVQLGGGIRNMETITLLLEIGVNRVILGTAAINNPEFVEEACKTFPGQVCLGVDAKNGQVAVEGWDEVTDMMATDLAQRFNHLPIAALIYTDISKDGMMTGPNIEMTVELARSISIPVIASGGVASREDVLALAHEGSGIAGAITGRAIYEKSLDFASTVAELKHAV